MPTVWKVAPGENAFLWLECLNDGVITINWRGLRPNNFASFESPSAISDAFRAVGDNKTASGSGPHSIYAFVTRMRPNQIVVASKGLHCVVGIGVVTSEYLHPNHPRNPRRKEPFHRHVRFVDWKIKKTLDLHTNLFHQKTVQELEPQKWKRIQREYLKHFPELSNEIEELFGSKTHFARETVEAFDLEVPPLRRVETTISVFVQIIMPRAISAQ